VVAALVLTFSVEVPEPLITEVGVNEQVGGKVTLGATLQDKLTAPLKPFIGVIVIVEVADPPAATKVGESAKAVTEKSGGGGGTAELTVSATVVSWLTEPDVSVTVTLEIPAGVLDDVATASAVVTGTGPGITDAGANEQLAPDGRPAEHENVSGLLKPFVALISIVAVPDCPAGIAILVGVAPALKSGNRP